DAGDGSSPGGFGGREKAWKNRWSLPAVITPEERPVAAADRDKAVGPLGRAVVNLQLAVLQKASQRLPLIQSVTHGRAGRALGQDFLLQFEQVLFQLADNPSRDPLPHCEPLRRRQRER